LAADRPSAGFALRLRRAAAEALTTAASTFAELVAASRRRWFCADPTCKSLRVRALFRALPGTMCMIETWSRWVPLHSKAVIRENQARRSAVKTKRAVVLGVFAMTLATVSSVRAQNPDWDASQSRQDSSVEGSLDGNEPESQPLFSIDGVGVHVWAPVESPYDSHANTNLATGSLFGADPNQSGY
jgi:hypothetical protein